MFGTTKAFLDYFGLKKLDDLPPLADLSDWESLRVQLDFPEVDEESGGGADDLDSSTGHDLPVLYPEETAESPGSALQSDDSEDPLEEEELVVSEWPDPVG